MQKAVLVVVCKERQEWTTAAIRVALVAHKQLALRALASAEVEQLVAAAVAAVTGVEPEALPMRVVAAAPVGLHPVFNLSPIHAEKMLVMVHSPLRQHKKQRSQHQQILLQLVGTIAFMCRGRLQRTRKQLAIASDGVCRLVLSLRSSMFLVQVHRSTHTQVAQWARPTSIPLPLSLQI
jgi:hypothetical protein